MPGAALVFHGGAWTLAAKLSSAPIACVGGSTYSGWFVPGACQSRRWSQSRKTATRERVSVAPAGSLIDAIEIFEAASPRSQAQVTEQPVICVAAWN